MILRAFVVPKQMLEKIVAQFPALLDRHFVISICDPGEARPLPGAHANLLNLTFCDIAPDDIPASERQRFPSMSQQDAVDVVNTLKRWHGSQLHGNLIVQCHAGISRSGAVGTFATELLELDGERFRKEHPWVDPQPYVLNLLRVAAGL